MTYLLGPVRSVAAMANTRVNPIEIEDCAGALLEMVDGSIAVSSGTLGSADEISRLRIMCEHVTMLSNLAPYQPGRDPWTFTPKGPLMADKIKAVVEAPVTGMEGYVAQFAAFHESLVSDAKLPVTFEEGRRSIELLTALYRACRTGARVALPILRSDPDYLGWQNLRPA